MNALQGFFVLARFNKEKHEASQNFALQAGASAESSLEAVR
jgi:hypothetical protein